MPLTGELIHDRLRGERLDGGSRGDHCEVRPMSHCNVSSFIDVAATVAAVNGASPGQRPLPLAARLENANLLIEELGLRLQLINCSVQLLGLHRLQLHELCGTCRFVLGLLVQALAERVNFRVISFERSHRRNHFLSVAVLPSGMLAGAFGNAQSACAEHAKTNDKAATQRINIEVVICRSHEAAQLSRAAQCSQRVTDFCIGPELDDLRSGRSGITGTGARFHIRVGKHPGSVDVSPAAIM